MLNLKFCEVHTPLFLNGINLGTKLDVHKRQGLTLQYDEKREFLCVWMNKQIALVPKETVVNMIPFNSDDTGYKEPKLNVKIHPPVSAPDMNPNIQAQVSTPHSHVFADAPGDTGVEKPKAKK